VPELTKRFPFVRLDPAELAAAGVDFETAATSQGFLASGQPVQFEEMETLDFVVVGCVAVTRAGGRTGKGGGFADLELGIFRELGKVGPGTPIATTVGADSVTASDPRRARQPASDAWSQCSARIPGRIYGTRFTLRLPLEIGLMSRALEAKVPRFLRQSRWFFSFAKQTPISNGE
jgi:hypothetical protein